MHVWKKQVALIAAALALCGNSPPMHTTPDVNVAWHTNEKTALHVELPPEDDFMAQCVRSGSEGRYIYEFQLCRRRRYWSDACLPAVLLLHSLRHETISESFILNADRIGDKLEGTTTSYDDLEAALHGLATVSSLPVRLLTQDAEGVESYLGKRGYISVRVRSDCHGGYNRTLARIGYFLSLGLVKVSGFTTGWVDFELDNRPAS